MPQFPFIGGLDRQIDDVWERESAQTPIQRCVVDVVWVQSVVSGVFDVEGMAFVIQVFIRVVQRQCLDDGWHFVILTGCQGDGTHVAGRGELPLPPG